MLYWFLSGSADCLIQNRIRVTASAVSTLKFVAYGGFDGKIWF